MKKELKLIYYSGNSSKFLNVSLNQKKIIMTCSLLFILFIIIISIFTFLFVKKYSNFQISNLKFEENNLLYRISSVQQNLDILNSKLKLSDKLDNDLRTMTELPILDEDTKKFGVGGTVENFGFAFDNLLPEIKNKIRNVNRTLINVEKRSSYQLHSFTEIESSIKLNKKKILHTPSIRPLQKGRLKSKFGYRNDPFLNYICHHNGIDIAARKGTPVLCPSNGVVIKVNETRNITKRLGKYVYVDHGFGIISIYGHLSQVGVKKGQILNRWDKIGEVGNTGRSTGDHLHYQININKKPVDPLNYIVNW
jgi:murein DD-endopeptidase MepM/ murein hydrolase activator NlpD